MSPRLPAFVFLVCAATATAPAPLSAQRGRPATTPAPALFEVHEQSILELQEAQTAGRVTARGLVQSYLARIAAYDQSGPALNAIVMVNPRALDDADALDRERAARGPRGPLHGIPVLVKDNYDIAGLPTSGGALGLATLPVTADAFQVQKLRAAGAVILGKTTMHELAAGITTISSLTGQTRNPYDLMRVPGGSSGGTGAAVAASFGAAGMGSDTCGSIRIPAANQNLVGLRATRGLSSRSGVMPLSDTQDVAGPLARTVTDLAIVLDATTGADAADAVTKDAAAHLTTSFQSRLKGATLKGLRIGVLRALWGTAPEDDEVAGILRKALDQMKAQGAEVVDATVPGLDDLLADSSVIADEFKFDLAAYLARHPGAPVTSLGEILERGLNHDALDATFRLRNQPTVRESEHYRQAFVKRRALTAAVEATLEAQKLDVLVYPTLRRKPTLIGEVQIGTTCQLSATTGLPALSMPAGFTVDGLPIGIEFLGPAFSDQALVARAYAWEQAATPRRAPFSTPALVNGRAPVPIVGELGGSVAGPAVAGRPAAASVPVTMGFTFDRTTGALDVRMALPQGVIAVALHRMNGDVVGPIVAHLATRAARLPPSPIVLRGRDREDFAAGRLAVRIYTDAEPLGLSPIRVRMPPLGAPTAVPRAQ